MTALAFIPARAGSKRIPRKNVRLLGGLPLVGHTIAAARAAEIFTEIVVSTDDPEVLGIAAREGVRGDARPEALGGDHVRFVEVLDEFLRRPANDGAFTHVAVLLPTCPFRSAEDIAGAFAMHRSAPPDATVVSVAAYDFPPEYACDLRHDGALQLRKPDVYIRSTQSQSLTPSYHPNGAIYLTTVAKFLSQKTFFAQPLLGYLMPPERSFDIDYPHQFDLAEALITTRK